MRIYIKLVCSIVLFTFILSLYSPALAENTSQTVQPFSDVPESNYAYSAVNELRQLGITDGVGNNNFGYGQTLTKGEFITFLVRLMGWKQLLPAKGSFTDNQDAKKFYYGPVETALANGAITKGDGAFRPAAAITREEAAVIIVKCLGYGDLADRLFYLEKPFTDVTNNIGYITIAKDFGIFSDASAFNPNGNALREQVAAILIRMINVLKRPMKDLNAFYAIKSSPQQEKITDLSSICFGWSALSYSKDTGNIFLNTSQNDNDYYLPIAFTQRLASAKQAGIPAMLMLQSSQDSKLTDPATGLQTGIPEYVLTHPEVYRKLISDIITSVNSTTLGIETGSFDGVAIDIEGLKGVKLRQCFNDFLNELKTALDKDGKRLYVAVQPIIHPKRSSSSFDGYDYKTIGSIADKVILMAHDYDAKKLTEADMARGFNITPPTPIEDVYYALEAITNTVSGVQDKSKIMLQISFNWTVWHKKDGKILNSRPDYFNLENFIKLLNSGTAISYQYAKEFANPYIKYTDTETGIENTVWYENTSSVMEKIKLARLFGIQGISLWRLGQIPDYQPTDGRNLEMDVWQNILNEMERK